MTETPLQAAMAEWLNEQLGTTQWMATPLAGDASFRRYLRIQAAERPPQILMDAPPEHENCEPFVRIARAWFDHRIPVPEIRAWAPELGAMLLEDFGDQTLAAALHAGAAAEPLYAQALTTLKRIQSLPPTAGLPAYDAALLRQEIDLFENWLINAYLDLRVPGSLRSEFEHWTGELVTRALQQPRVTVHRDYHSRNLMVRSQGLGVIDFQDAVQGPLTYDLVSLLKDCYQRLPAAQVDRLFQSWFEGLPAAQQQELTLAECRRDFELMGMQRHLKAAGIFARLWLRDRKPGYLQDIPNTLQHLLDALHNSGANAAIAHWLSSEVQPALSQRLSRESAR